jgi:hypothetical protein
VVVPVAQLNLGQRLPQRRGVLVPGHELDKAVVLEQLPPVPLVLPRKATFLDELGSETVSLATGGYVPVIPGGLGAGCPGRAQKSVAHRAAQGVVVPGAPAAVVSAGALQSR